MIRALVANEAGDDRTFSARKTHRLEAFSDIVVGFSLGQLGLSLIMPAHAVDFVKHPASIFAFVVTFLVVVRFWWFGFITFEHFFTPARLTISLVFAALGALILQIFALQMYLHFVPLHEGGVASRIYFVFFVLAYGLQGSVLLLGLAARWRILDRRARLMGVRAAVSRTCLVAAMFAGDLRPSTAVASIVTRVGTTDTLVANLPTTLFAFSVGGAIVGIVLAALVPVVFPSLRIPRGATTAATPAG